MRAGCIDAVDAAPIDVNRHGTPGACSVKDAPGWCEQRIEQLSERIARFIAHDVRRKNHARRDAWESARKSAREKSASAALPGFRSWPHLAK